MVVVLSLILTRCIQDRSTGLLVGDSQCLWELDWLRLPSAASTSLVGSVASSTSSTSSFAQWHHRLGHLCGLRLSTLVRRGLLGSSWSFRVNFW